MTKSNIDLHMHTTFSDGTDTPRELLDVLRKTGVTTFAVTDHDEICGSLAMERLLEEAEDKEKFHFVRGVELSCKKQGVKCHLLGYDFDPENEQLLAQLSDATARRESKMPLRIRYLEETYGIVLTEEERQWLDSLHRAGRPHLAKILVDRGAASSINDGIVRMINPCKTPSSRLEADEAIAAVHAAGGIVSWAHPLGGEGEVHLPKEEFEARLKMLKGYGIDALECYYSRYSIEEIRYLKAVAERENLAVSGGSDYHGTIKTIDVGTVCSEEIRVTKEFFTITTQFKH